ncbi:MAG: RNA methyltransferase [Thermomicrobiales bacterium]|nr:RNA methyltransferase [Thermomicrobiales bacterium]
MSDDNRSPQTDEIITSGANPTIKLARSLHRRKSRERERAVLVEGLRSIEAALESGATPRAFLIDAAHRNVIPANLVERYAQHARVVVVEHELFLSVTLTEHPQPVVALVSMPDLPAVRNASLVLAIDGVRDPGNIGTMIRSAAAAGADAIALLPGSADPFNPKAIRATAGALFQIPLLRVGSVEFAVDRLFTQRPTVVIADANADRTYDAVDWNEPTVIVVGGEAFGASEESRTYADSTVAIPIQPGVESLNAGVAASILLFEAMRHRRVSK